MSQCDNRSTCVNDKNFYVQSLAGGCCCEACLLGKTSYRFYTIAFEGYAAILDAQGNEFKVHGKDISCFNLSEGEKRVLSLKFRGDKQKKIAEPFDLTIKTRYDEITLFDLKQM